MRMSLVKGLHKQYVRGSERKAIVKFVEVLLCQLPNSVVKGVNLPCNRVYINTRVMKHAYDKRPAQDYDMLIDNMIDIVKLPGRIYKNKDGKRGSFCFTKQIKNTDCLCSIEIVETANGDLVCEVATFFVPGDSYLGSLELLWEWKGGKPSS